MDGDLWSTLQREACGIKGSWVNSFIEHQSEHAQTEVEIKCHNSRVVCVCNEFSGSLSLIWAHCNAYLASSISKGG